VTGIGYPDWQPASRAMDDPAVLAADALVAVPAQTALLDVRRWASYALFCEYDAPNAGPPGNTALASITFYDTPLTVNPMHYSEWELNSFNSTDCGSTFISGPMRGGAMLLGFTAGRGGGANVNYRLIGSNRVLPRDSARELGPLNAAGEGIDRQIFQIRFAAMAAGFSRRNVRLGVGPAQLAVTIANVAGTVMDVALYSPQLDAVGTERLYVRRALGPNAILSQPIILPQRCLCVEFNNTGGTLPQVDANITVAEG